MNVVLAVIFALLGSGGGFGAGIGAGFGAGIGAGMAAGMAAGKRRLEEQLRDIVTRRGLRLVDSSGHAVPLDSLLSEASSTTGVTGSKRTAALIAAGAGILLLGLLVAFMLAR